MDLQAIDIAKVDGAPKLWQEIVDASSDGWLWHTWLSHEFNLCAGEKYAARDLSFFVYDRGRAVGVVPLIIEEREGTLQAAYYSGFLPWPCFRKDVQNREALEDFACTELEQRARKAGAESIFVFFAPPQNTSNEESRVRRIAFRNGYETIISEHHFTEVMPQLLVRVCSRYDYKRFSPFFELSVAEGACISLELEEKYFALHVSDAGGQFRSRESYGKQTDSAREGEGFYVVARHKKTGAIAGMALINVYKGTAYYGSVAVAPEMSKSCIGYQLQCRAVEELLARGIRYYDLGPVFTSEREKGISLFKSKISGTGSRLVYLIRKSL